MKWTFPCAIRASEAFTVAQMLAAAVNERAIVCSVPLVPSPKRLMSYYDFANGLNTAIRELIPRFANHTVNNGDFSGLPEIPMWTDESIAVVLGEDAARIRTHRLDDISAWAFRQYRIINLLRWHKQTNGVCVHPQPSGIVYWSSVDYNSPAEALSAACQGGGITANNFSAEKDIQIRAILKDAGVKYGAATGSYETTVKFMFATDKYSVNAVLMGKNTSVSQSHRDGGIFDITYDEQIKDGEKWYVLSEKDNCKLNYVSEKIGDKNVLATGLPSVPAAGQINWRFGGADIFSLIAKYDGTDGFRYITNEPPTT